MPDEVYDEARKQFSEEELVNLTFALVAINGANRLNIAFRTVPGSHEVPPESRRVARFSSWPQIIDQSRAQKAQFASSRLATASGAG